MSKQTGAPKKSGGGKSGAIDLGAITPVPDFPKGGIVNDSSPEFIGDFDTPGNKPITMARWEKAQRAEREQHKLGYIEGVLHYAKAYKHYFRFVGLGNDLHGLNVIEIGPADFPALQHCVNFNGVIVEPMPSEPLLAICKEKGITLVTEPFEFTGLNNDTSGIVEVWLFNVMQHVINPALFIEKAKTIANRIRFFEPINQPITEYHPHTYTLEDYQNWFGQSVNLYAGGSVEGFHEADCVYGCWIKD